MGIPYTFQNQTGPIPLSELDANFTATRTDLANTSSPALGTGLVGWFKSLANFVGRTLSAKLSDQYSVCDYGAVDDGSTNNATFLANCPATDLLVPPGTYLVNSNTTIVANLRFAAGAILKPASGVTITLSASFSAPLAQIFAISAGGVVVLNRDNGIAYPQWWGARGDGPTDDTAAIQACVKTSRNIYFVANSGSAYYKITAAIAVNAGTRISGPSSSLSATLGVWGCDAFVIGNGTANSGNSVIIENLQLINYSNSGVIDSRSNNGIRCAGTNTANVNYFVASNLYLRGWASCIRWEYTWYSEVNNVQTINCNYGVNIFGQSVNNFITNSSLLANGGTASISATYDPVTNLRGEGLSITGCLLADGQYGIVSNSFLLLCVANSIIDQITDTGILCAPAGGWTIDQLLVTNSWIYAANYGVEFTTAGSATNISAALSNNFIQTTSATGITVLIGTNNNNVSIVSGELQCAVGGQLVNSSGTATIVSCVQCINPGAVVSLALAASDSHASGNAGNCSVSAGGVTGNSLGLLPVAWIHFTGSTGAVLASYNISVSRTGTGSYNFTFGAALSSGNYMVLASGDRGGNGCAGYSVSSQTADRKSTRLNSSHHSISY